MSKKTTDNTPTHQIPMIIGPYNAAMLVSGLSELLTKAQITLDVIGETLTADNIEKVVAISKESSAIIGKLSEALLSESQQLAQQTMAEELMDSHGGNRPKFMN